MAYMRPLDEQNQQKTEQGQTVGQPLQNTSSGSGQIVSSNPGVAASSSANTYGQGPTRSNANWVNVEDYLNANPSFGQKAIDKGNELISKEGENFANASKPLEQATKNFSYSSMTPEEIDAGLRMGSIDKIKQTLNQPGWTGPDSTGYDINKSGNVANARSLSNINTATDVLAKDAIDKGQYGFGLRALDQGLLGADQNYKNNAQKLWSNVDSFVGKTNQRNNELNQLAGYDKNKAEEARSNAKNAIDSEKSEYQKNIDEQLKSKKSQADWAKKGYYNAYQQWYDNIFAPKQQANAFAAQHGKPEADYTADDLFSYSPIKNYNENPTTGNVGSDQDYKVLSEIGNLLGEQPIYTRQGSYNLPTYNKDNGASVINDWIANYGKQYQNSPYPIQIGNNFAANRILSSGKIETPDELAKRLGIK